MSNSNKTQQGFSLTEMMIVLSVVAFLIAAIVLGQGLIERGRIKNMISELQFYQSAFQNFHNQYAGLPGDLLDANSEWSAASNGDGDMKMEWATEGPQVWLHMQLAGMIEFSGMTGTFPSGTLAAIGTNVPASRVDNVGYFADWDTVSRYNYIGLGSQLSDGANQGAVIMPKQALNMDEKIDDGKSDTGNLRGNNQASPATNCVVSGNYNTVSTLEECWLSYKLALIKS